MEFEIFFNDINKKSKPCFSIRLDGEVYEFYYPQFSHRHDFIVLTLERLAVERLLGLAKHGRFPESNEPKILACIRKQLQKPLEDYAEFLKQFELEIDKFVQRFEDASVEVQLKLSDTLRLQVCSFHELFSEIVFVNVSVGSESSLLRVKNCLPSLKDVASKFVLAALPEHLKTNHAFAEAKDSATLSLTNKMKIEVEKAVEEGKRGEIGEKVRELFRQDAKKRVKSLATQMSMLAMGLELSYGDVLEIVKETLVEHIHES
jgi:Arc/MetJ-type ribon-helix-helix transcriptional regulator